MPVMTGMIEARTGMTEKSSRKTVLVLTPVSRIKHQACKKFDMNCSSHVTPIKKRRNYDISVGEEMKL